MMAISYPISFPATPGPATVQWRPANSVGLVSTPRSWIERVQQNAGDLLRVEVDMPAMTRALGEPWHAALMSLDGVFGTVLYGPSGDAKTPRGTATGTPLVKGAGQSGDDLITDGWTTGITGIMLAGDWLSVGSGATQRLYKVMADADSDGSGNATISIWPSLRESPADDAAITVASPTGIFRLVEGTLALEIDRAQNYHAAFALIEARRGT